MTDWIGSPRTWPDPTPYVVTGTDLNEELRDRVLHLYERRSPSIADMFTRLLVQDTGIGQPIAIDGVSLLNAEANLYTVPVGKVFILSGFTIWNATASAFTPIVRLCASGTGASAADTICAEPLYALEDWGGEGPWFMEAGDFISGLALGASANEIAVRFDGILLTAQPPGHTLRMIDGALVGTSFTPLVTSAGHETLQALTIVNQHTLAVRVDAAIVESGGSVSNAKQILGREFSPGESITFDRHFVLESGDTVQLKAATASVIAARPTVVRVNA